MKSFDELDDLHQFICSKCENKLFALNKKREEELEKKARIFAKENSIHGGLWLQSRRQTLLDRKHKNLDELLERSAEKELAKYDELIKTNNIENIISQEVGKIETGEKDREILREIFTDDAWLAASMYDSEKYDSKKVPFDKFVRTYFQYSLREYFADAKTKEGSTKPRELLSLDIKSTNSDGEETGESLSDSVSDGGIPMDEKIDCLNFNDADIMSVFWNPETSETLCVYCRRRILKEIYESPGRFKPPTEQYSTNVFERRKIWLDMERSIQK